METTNLLARRISLIAALILGSTSWFGAQNKQSHEGISLVGTTVKNQQGEEMGKIQDLVIAFASARVAYVVLASKSGLFSSTKLLAMRLRAFQRNFGGTTLTLNADKAKLMKSEGFDKNYWPAVGKATWTHPPSPSAIQKTQWRQFPRGRSGRNPA